MILLLLTLITTTGFAEESSVFNEYNGKIGFGYGIPYGGVGTNTEIVIGDYFSLTAGVGGMYSHLNAVGGIKAYFLSPKSGFRPRISAYGGNVGIVETHEKNGFGKSTIKGLTGEALAIGFEKRLNEKVSFDFDIVKAFYELPENATVKGSITKISLGICFFYNLSSAKK